MTRKSLGISSKVLTQLGPTGDEAAELLVDKQEIPLARILLDDLNPRRLGLNPEDPAAIDDTDPQAKTKRERLEALYELRDSIIATGGLIHPVTVYRQGDNFRVVAGERRVLAHRLMEGKQTITALVYDEKPKALRQIQFQENVNREDLTLWERLEGAGQLVREHEAAGRRIDRHEDLQQILSCRRTAAFRWHRLLNAPDDVLVAIREGRVTGLKQAASIATIDDAAERAAAISKTADADEPGPPPENPPAPPAPAPAGRGRPRKHISLSVPSAKVAQHLVKRLGAEREFRNVDWADLRDVTKRLQEYINQLETTLK